MIKWNKPDGDNIFFLIFAPIVIAVIWYNYGFKLVIATSLLFAGLYVYYFAFLNIIYAVKAKDIGEYKQKIIIFSLASITIFCSSLKLYGLEFALKGLVMILVISSIQSIIVLRK